MNIFGVIFDRDGTLIEHVPYISDPAKVALLPGVYEGLRRLSGGGVKLFMHTNQSGVGRGMFEMEAVGQCNDRMFELLEMGPDVFERICIAPEKPDQPSKYRKPSPEFAKELAAAYGQPLSAFCYVGDRASDLATADAAGCSAIGVRTGLGDLDEELASCGLTGKYAVVDCFSEVADRVLG